MGRFWQHEVLLVAQKLAPKFLKIHFFCKKLNQKNFSKLCLFNLNSKRVIKDTCKQFCLVQQGLKMFLFITKTKRIVYLLYLFFLSSRVYFVSTFSRHNTFFLDLWYTKFFLFSGTFAYFAVFFFFLICLSIHLTLFNHIIMHVPQVLLVFYLNK